MKYKELEKWRKNIESLQDSKQKTCVICNEQKSILNFIWTPTNMDNRSHICRTCSGKIKHNISSINSIIDKIKLTITQHLQ